MREKTNENKGINHIVQYCGSLKADERVMILYDSTTAHIAELFKGEAAKFTETIELAEINFCTTHGIEPPVGISASMCASDLIICLTSSSLAHTRARLEAEKKGARFLSLPQYTSELLHNAAVRFPYRELIDLMERVTEIFDKGKNIEIKSEAGTKLMLNIQDRKGNCCPGIVNEMYRLGSPPDAEVNIAPVETASEGVLVVDGSITCMEIGLLKEKVTLEIVCGKIDKIYSTNKSYTEKLLNIFKNVGSPKAYYLAECGIGFNKAALLCGNMLIDEGCFGCVHFGFGSNITINGKNDVNFHLDFVIKKPTLMVDDFCILKEGVFWYERCNEKF